MSDETQGGPRDEEKSRSSTSEETVFDGSQAPMSLGASATFAAEKKRRGRKGSAGGAGGTGGAAGSEDAGGRSWIPTIKPGLAILVGLLLVVAFAFFPMVASSLKKTPKDKVGISYGGGPFEGARFQKVVMPGSSLFFNGWFDPLYLYPADQQNYIVSGNPVAAGDGGDADTAGTTASNTASAGSKSSVSGQPVVAPSKDRVQVSYQAAIYFRLNVDNLRQFHEEFGLKYEAFNDPGWKNLIQDTLRQQIENALLEETRRYDVSDVYGDVDVLLSIQKSVQDTLSNRLELAMGGQYFCAPTYEAGGECGTPTFVVKSVDVPTSISNAFNENKSSLIGIQTRTNEAEQRRIEADGVKVLNEALGANGNVYAMLRAIEEGQTTFWVVPEGNGLNLDTSGDGSSAPVTPNTADSGDGG